jgi:3-phosphoshikimate 1-carboxyvinyltransferase
MATLIIKPGKSLQGTSSVPGDKSISHRALMLGGIAKGTSQVRGWLPAGDTNATLNCMRGLGVKITQHDATTLTVEGGDLRKPDAPLNMVNAGTGIRLLAGLLAGQNFETVIDGSEQLRRRPMKRITEPLRQMGADISDTNGYCPLTIKPAELHSIHFAQPVASAQVKSCLLLAGLYADSPTTVIEPAPGRDHTERMLKAMGVPIEVNDGAITIQPYTDLKPLDLTIPGDISSAAFLIVGGILVEGSEITLTGINTNERRTGLLDVLSRMGATIMLDKEREEGGEPVADLVISAQNLQGTTVKGSEVVRMIDEFPILMVAATQSEGQTLVQEAEELRVKETDRIAVMAGELRKMGADISELPDGFAVQGKQSLRGAVVDSHDDHRIGMSLAIAALMAEGETQILDAGCVHDSFPGFENVLAHLGVDLEWRD